MADWRLPLVSDPDTTSGTPHGRHCHFCPLRTTGRRDGIIVIQLKACRPVASSNRIRTTGYLVRRRICCPLATPSSRRLSIITIECFPVEGIKGTWIIWRCHGGTRLLDSGKESNNTSLAAICLTDRPDI